MKLIYFDNLQALEFPFELFENKKVLALLNLDFLGHESFGISIFSSSGLNMI